MIFEDVWNNSSHITSLISKEEGKCLWDLVLQLPENSTVVEIGSYVGKSSYILASACLERNSKLICIDPFIVGFDGVTKHYAHTRDIFAENILKVFKNVKLYDMTSTKASKYIKKIDFLFVDGGHDYEDVRDDCINYLPKLVSGGCVSFHDYTNKGLGGVRQAVDEYAGTWAVVNNIWSITTRRKPQ